MCWHARTRTRTYYNEKLYLKSMSKIDNTVGIVDSCRITLRLKNLLLWLFSYWGLTHYHAADNITITIRCHLECNCWQWWCRRWNNGLLGKQKCRSSLGAASSRSGNNQQCCAAIDYIARSSHSQPVSLRHKARSTHTLHPPPAPSQPKQINQSKCHGNKISHRRSMVDNEANDGSKERRQDRRTGILTDL